jgi:excinuclease UvrABC helicase subunit UvrB
MSVELSDEQREAKRLIDAFLTARRVDKPWFTLMGLAGTGKTFVLSQIGRQLGRSVMCAVDGRLKIYGEISP